MKKPILNKSTLALTLSNLQPEYTTLEVLADDRIAVSVGFRFIINAYDIRPKKKRRAKR